MEHDGLDENGITIPAMVTIVCFGSATSPSLHSAPEPAVHGADMGTHPPCFYKLELMTYDGAEDPLNWLNHCE